jgi:signal peptidase I
MVFDCTKMVYSINHLSFAVLSGSLKFPAIQAEKTAEGKANLAMNEESASKDNTNTPVQGFKLAFELKSWSRDILLAIAIAIFIVIFVVQPVKVEGTSMQPQLSDQDRIFVNRFIYRFKEIIKGEVVVFWYPKDRSKSFIKRVIGVPGDFIEIRRGMVYVNGERIDEPYLKPEFRDFQSFSKVVVPQEMYFVLGDHRNSSNDSRSWGFVEKSLIYGKAIFSYWPVSHVGLVE